MTPGPADSGEPATFWTVTADPSTPVIHGLEIKSALDAERRFVTLRGPQLFSGPEKVASGELPDYLNWYKIRKPPAEPVKTLSVSDGYSEGSSFELRLGTPQYFLMPAKRIQSGPPPKIPENLNHFIAFAIENADDLKVSKAVPGKPAFLCVPAEEWHHEENFPIKSPATYLMVYEAEGSPESPKATTIDQFGINALATAKKQYVYVIAKAVR